MTNLLSPRSVSSPPRSVSFQGVPAISGCPGAGKPAVSLFRFESSDQTALGRRREVRRWCLHLGKSTGLWPESSRRIVFDDLTQFLPPPRHVEIGDGPRREEDEVEPQDAREKAQGIEHDQQQQHERDPSDSLPSHLLTPFAVNDV